jgi:hypothetical protein
MAIKKVPNLKGMKQQHFSRPSPISIEDVLLDKKRMEKKKEKKEKEEGQWGKQGVVKGEKGTADQIFYWF